jgi:cell division protein FtsW
LFGGVMVIGIYLFLLYRCIKIVTKAPKAFGALLAAGLSFSLTIQAFANMAVAVGLGAGNRSAVTAGKHGRYINIVYQCAFGIILSVSRDIDEPKKCCRGDGEISVAA